MCARADYISLHLPALPSTKHIFNAERFAKCKKGVRIINTARGELIDEAALADAIEKGQVAGAGLDVFDVEPPKDWRLATPAAGGRDTAHRGVDEGGAGAGRHRDRRGAARFSQGRHHPERRELPFRLAGGIQAAAALPDARQVISGWSWHRWAKRGSTPSASAITASLRQENNQLLGSAVLEGVFCAILSSGGVTPVNARTIAAERGIELIESRSTRPRNYTSLISVKLHTERGDRWVEGTVFANGSLRLVLSMASTSKRRSTARCSSSRTTISPASSATSARCSAAIASTSRASPSDATRSAADCAIGVVNVDEHAGRGSAGTVTDEVLAEIRAIPNIRSVWRVRLDG